MDIEKLKIEKFKEIKTSNLQSYIDRLLSNIETPLYPFNHDNLVT